MSVVINTNTAASIAANNLGYANNQLTDAINQLSSGSRLSDPALDPGSIGVSLRLTAAAADAGVSSTIDQNQLAALQTQDAAINVMGSIVTRMSELAAMAGDTTKTSADVANYSAEFSKLSSQLSTLDTASGDTGSAVSSLTAITSLTTSTLSTTVTAINNAISAVGNLAAANGAAQAAEGFQSQYDASNQTNLEAANSAISDVDVAQESAQLARWNVLVQAGTAMLAQANQEPNIALKLLQ